MCHYYEVSDRHDAHADSVLDEWASQPDVDTVDKSKVEYCLSDYNESHW
jgi:hypothetical protein